MLLRHHPSIGKLPCVGDDWRLSRLELDALIWREGEELCPGGERKLTGKQEALLVATACSALPKGRKRWTLELLAGEMVKLTEHDGLSRETIRRRLAENDLKPWRRDMWCIPEVDGILCRPDGRRARPLRRRA